MSLTLKIPTESKLHKKVASRLQQYIKWAERAQSNQHKEWQDAEEAMLAYVPTSAADQRRDDSRDDGVPAYSTIVLPYTYAAAMAAHTYWTSVFYARSPVYQFTGRHGEPQQGVQAVEAIIDYQYTVGAHGVPNYSWIYDVARYGFGVVAANWEKDVRHVAIVEDLAEQATPDELLFGEATPNKSKRIVQTYEIENYEGNKVRNVSPWDWLPDPRVSMNNFQKGEFCAERKRLNWNEIVVRQAQGYYFDENVEKIKSSRGSEYQNTNYGTQVIQRPEDRSFIENVEGLDHPGTVYVYEVFVNLIPSEWGIPGGDYPQKWCFTITQDFSLVLGASPLNNYHCEYPYDLMKLDLDAYASYSRGIPRIGKAVQDTMTWLLNTHFYNVRASLQNLFIVDPSRVSLADLEDPLPGGIVRVREAFYGQDVRQAIHQVDIKDITQQHMGEIPFMQAIGERILGVNDSVMGAQNPGGRRTATEVRSTTGFSVNRMKTSGEFMGLMGLQPHARKLVMNSQQFYSSEKKLRIAGGLLEDAQNFLDVTPESIQGFYDYVPVDGNLPIDRLAQVTMWKELFMQMQATPQIAMEYDIGKMFMWVASLAGMKNIRQFKVDLQDPAVIQKQLMMGNLMQQPKPGGRTSGSRGNGAALSSNASGGASPIV